MDGYSFYKIYQPLFLHFTTNYDCIKYGQKSKNISIDRYEKSQWKTRFNVYGNKFHNDKQAFGHCVANMVYGENGWLYEPYNPDITDLWNNINVNFSDTFKTDVELLKSYIIDGKIKSFKFSINKTPSGNKPPLLQLCITRRITYESIIILDKWFSLLDKWEDSDPLVQRELQLIRKYKPFVVSRHSNTNELLKIFKESF